MINCIFGFDIFAIPEPRYLWFGISGNITAQLSSLAFTSGEVRGDVYVWFRKRYNRSEIYNVRQCHYATQI